MDPPLCSSRACLRTAFIAFSVVLGGAGGGGGIQTPTAFSRTLPYLCKGMWSRGWWQCPLAAWLLYLPHARIIYREGHRRAACHFHEVKSELPDSLPCFAFLHRPGESDNVVSGLSASDNRLHHPDSDSVWGRGASLGACHLLCACLGLAVTWAACDLASLGAEAHGHCLGVSGTFYSKG